MSKKLIITVGILGLSVIFILSMASLSTAAKGGKPDKPEERIKVCLENVYGANGLIALIPDPNEINPYCFPPCSPNCEVPTLCNYSDFSARKPQIVMKYVTLDVSYFCNADLRNEGCKCFNCSPCDVGPCDDPIIYDGVHYGGASEGPSYGILVLLKEEDEVGAYYYSYGTYDSGGCEGGKNLMHGLYLSAAPGANPWPSPPYDYDYSYTFEFTDWEMFVGEAPGKDRKRACTGFGTFDGYPVHITITLAKPDS